MVCGRLTLSRCILAIQQKSSLHIHCHRCIQQVRVGIPLKSKGGNETAKAIAEIIRKSKRCPKNLQTDMGKEFYNIDVQWLLKK